MSQRIHIAIDGISQGTFTTAELAQLWDAGELSRTAVYWHRGLPSWKPVSEFAPPAEDVGLTGENAIVLATTPTLPGREVERCLGLVSAECVQGAGLMSDLAAGFTDVTGGRSTRLETILANAKTACMADLRKRAHALRADAVVGVSLSASEVSGKGTLMLLVTSAGTAVRLADQPPELV